MKKILALIVLVLVGNGAYAADIRMEGNQQFQNAILFSSKKLQVIFGLPPM